MNIRPLVLIMLTTLLCLPIADAATDASPAKAKPPKHASKHANKHLSKSTAAAKPAAPVVVEDTTPALFPLPNASRPTVISSEMRFVSIGHITFATNKADLIDASRFILDQAVMYLSLHQGASRLLIRGYTDDVGSVEFNDKLSNKRAAAVRDYLVKKGINVEWVRWEGHGERAPIDENWTELGRARNRQVELFAIYPPPTTTSN